MARYIAYRLAHSVGVVFAVSFIVFMLAHLTGDPGALLLPPEASAQDVEEFRRKMGLDQPLLVQYFGYLARAVQGDLGVSLWTRQPTVEVVLDRLPATLLLGGMALLVSTLFALPVGIYAALHRGSAADRLLLGLTVFGQSMPVFWFGLMLILFFAVYLRWLPTGGMGGPEHLVLPVLALSTYAAARNARVLRSSMIETLSTDYVRTAHAKGLPDHVVTWRHAFRNAMLPLVTLLGLQFGILLGGAIVTETVFSWPGVGRLVAEAITHRDFPLLQTAVLLLALAFVVVNLIVDLLYAVIDPRIRLAT